MHLNEYKQAYLWFSSSWETPGILRKIVQFQTLYTKTAYWGNIEIITCIVHVMRIWLPNANFCKSNTVQPACSKHYQTLNTKLSMQLDNHQRASKEILYTQSMSLNIQNSVHYANFTYTLSLHWTKCCLYKFKKLSLVFTSCMYYSSHTHLWGERGNVSATWTGHKKGMIAEPSEPWPCRFYTW